MYKEKQGGAEQPGDQQAPHQDESSNDDDKKGPLDADFEQK